VKPIKERKKINCIFPFILKLTTGPELVSSAEPGCSPFIILGIINIKKGTVKKAITEYTADRVALFSSDSIDERSANQAPYIKSNAKILVCLGSQLQYEPHANFAHTAPVIVASTQNIIPS
jgi:cephalosporin hydroxylase